MADHKNPIPWEVAMEVAQTLQTTLNPACEKIQIAGSLRRRKPLVNDIEILLIPKLAVIPDPENMFPDPSDMALLQIEALIQNGVLEKRKKSNGTVTYGSRTKLLIHSPTQTPVDIFTCDERRWVNCLFSRTGGKTSNISVAAGAKRRGLAWKPFDAGFQTGDGRMIEIKTEEEIFRIVGLPYISPHKRE